MIKATCYSDDRCVEAFFDATPWFSKATDQEIIDLRECEWGGDYAADDVAIYMADINVRVKDMFTYMHYRSRIETIGFECHVSEEDALTWIKINRPHLIDTFDNA